MMIKRSYNCFIFFIIYPLISISQSLDHQTWTNFEFTTNTIYNTELSFSQSFRFIENSKSLSKYFSDLNIKREYNKLFSHSMGYRYLIYRDIDDFEIEKNHRFYIDAIFKEKLFKRFRATYRTRLQAQKKPNDIENKIRQRIKFIYNFNKIDLKLSFSFEGFYLINHYLEKVRYMVGVSKSLNQKTTINLNYMMQREFNVDNPDIFFIFRTKVSYSI